MRTVSLIRNNWEWDSLHKWFIKNNACVYARVHWLLLICVFYFLHTLKVVVMWYPWMDAARIINCLQVSGGCFEVVQILVPCPQVAEIRWWWHHLVTSKQFSPRRWKYWLLKSTETLGYMAPPTKALRPDLHWLPAGQCRWWKVAWENGSFDLPGSQGILVDCVFPHRSPVDYVWGSTTLPLAPRFLWSGWLDHKGSKPQLLDVATVCTSPTNHTDLSLSRYTLIAFLTPSWKSRLSTRGPFPNLQSTCPEAIPCPASFARNPIPSCVATETYSSFMSKENRERSVCCPRGRGKGDWLGGFWGLGVYAKTYPVDTVG